MTSRKWNAYYYLLLLHVYTIFGGFGIWVLWSFPERWQAKAFGIPCLALAVGYTILFFRARRRNLSPLTYLSMITAPKSRLDAEDRLDQDSRG